MSSEKGEIIVVEIRFIIRIGIIKKKYGDMHKRILLLNMQVYLIYFRDFASYYY